MNSAPEFFARRARERWPLDAPRGYRLVRAPELVVPGHDVIVELWDDCFVAGSPDLSETLPGYGSTPLEAIVEHERKNFYALHDLAAAYSGFLPAVVPKSTTLGTAKRPAWQRHLDRARPGRTAAA